MFIESVFMKWFLVLVNRLASWFGSGYFVKKGFKQRQWRFFAIALLISGVMFALLLIGTM